jgi:hypothetical protein
MAETNALSEKQEKEFQTWIKNTGWYKEYVTQYKEEPDLNIAEYDYRAAWKAGVKPERYEYDNNRYHWPSVDPKSGKPLKSSDHPTAWKEDYMQRTGKNPDEVGATKQDYEKMTGSKMLMRTPNPGANKIKG